MICHGCEGIVPSGAIDHGISDKQMMEVGFLLAGIATGEPTLGIGMLCVGVVAAVVVITNVVNLAGIDAGYVSASVIQGLEQHILGVVVAGIGVVGYKRSEAIEQGLTGEIYHCVVIFGIQGYGNKQCKQAEAIFYKVFCHWFLLFLSWCGSKELRGHYPSRIVLAPQAG